MLSINSFTFNNAIPFSLTTSIFVHSIFRLILTKEHIKWADILVPVGGDGTFLMTAGRASVFNPTVTKTPLVGFNSDPLRSEGRLMLPKSILMIQKKLFDESLR